MKSKLLCGLAASLLSVSILVSPALAQSPGANWELVETNPRKYFVADPANPGAGWTLVGSDTVRYFVPGSTPPAGADLADAARAPSITSQDPASNEWLLAGTENVKDFIPDGPESGSDQLVASTFVSSRNEQQTYSGGRQKLSGEPSYDPEVRETDTKKWRLTSQTATVRRYDVPLYRNVHTPYRIVDRFGYETRRVDTYDNTYRASKTVKTALGQEVVDTHTYSKREDKPTAWVRGDIVPSLDKLVSTGVDDTTQTTYQQYVVDLLAGKVAESDKAQSTKASTFMSDSGSGNSKTALSGSQKRVTFKADQAVASVAKKAEDKGSIKDPTVGKEEATRKAEAAKKAEDAAKKAADEAAKVAARAAEEAAKAADAAAKKAAEEAAKAAEEAAKKAAEESKKAVAATLAAAKVNVKATDWDRKFYNPANAAEYLDFSVNNGKKLTITVNVPKKITSSGWYEGKLSTDKASYVDSSGDNECTLKLSYANGQWLLNGSIAKGKASVSINNWIAR